LGAGPATSFHASQALRYHKYVVRRSPNDEGPRQSVKRKPARHGAMIVTKRGVYLVRGDRKLKSFRLISWEQLLSPSPGSHT
jgi:hypothetical protein